MTMHTVQSGVGQCGKKGDQNETASSAVPSQELVVKQVHGRHEWQTETRQGVAMMADGHASDARVRARMEGDVCCVEWVLAGEWWMVAYERPQNVLVFRVQQAL